MTETTHNVCEYRRSYFLITHLILSHHRRPSSLYLSLITFRTISRCWDCVEWHFMKSTLLKILVYHVVSHPVVHIGICYNEQTKHQQLRLQGICRYYTMLCECFSTFCSNKWHKMQPFFPVPLKNVIVTWVHYIVILKRLGSNFYDGFKLKKRQIHAMYSLTIFKTNNHMYVNEILGQFRKVLLVYCTTITSELCFTDKDRSRNTVFIRKVMPCFTVDVFAQQKSVSSRSNRVVVSCVTN